MAAAVDTYTPAAYDHRAMVSIPDIGASAGKFAQIQGFETMKSLIRDVFIKHGVQDIFGVGLLHKHYELAPNEKIVELGPLSSPWVLNGGGDSDDDMVGGTIFAHTWRVFEGALTPVEYTFVPRHKVLEATGLDAVLGINLVARRDDRDDVRTMEVTFGRSSIIIPATDREDAALMEASNLEKFQAAWYFTKDTVKNAHDVCIGHGQPEGVKDAHDVCIGHGQVECAKTAQEIC